MPALWLRFRAELRARWRAWLGLALLVGLASGAVMALAAGARRTDSAYDRFLDAHNAYDVLVVNYPEDGTATFDFRELAQLPQVADSARAHFEYYTFFAGNLVSEDGRIGTEINRFKLLEGRRADPDAADEIVVGFALAEEHDLRVGDTVDLIPREFIEFVQDPDSAPNPFPEDVPPGQIEADIAAGRALLAEIPDGRVRIVGIEASPGEFPPQFAVNRPLVHLTPAAHRLLDDDEHEALMVRLRGGADGLDDFRAELERRSGGEPPQLVVQRDHAAAVERSIRFQAVGLWLLAGLTALAAVLIVGQLLARLTHIESADAPVLRALGLSPRARVGLGVLRAAAIGVAGAVLGVGDAWAASGAFPTGLARTAEPSPGVHADLLVLLVGLLATVLVMATLSLWPAWRAARAERVADGGPLAPSRMARAVALRGAPAPATVGVRMAIEPGRGRTAVPVRTTLAGVMLGIGVLTAVLTFGASLTHLLATPRLYGVTWDLELASGDTSGLGADAVEFLRADDRVTALAVGAAAFAPSMEIEGERLDALVLASEPAKGEITPPVLEGRAPAGPDEIALGPQTLRSLGVTIGDQVEVGVGARAIPMAVVGSVVSPTVSENTQLGSGALITPEAELLLDAGDDDEGTDDEGDDDTDEAADSEIADDEGEGVAAADGQAETDRTVADAFGVLLRLAPGVDRGALVADLTEHLDLNEDAGEFVVTDDAGEPTDIVNFGRVESLPFVLGGILAAIAGGALTHLLVTAVRRRRRDLAILKTLGFVRHQMAGTVTAQATTVVAVGLLVGVPVGIAVGRWVWTLMADDLGVVSRPQVPLAALAAIVGAAFVVANAIAFLPGQVAARTRPATILRSE